MLLDNFLSNFIQTTDYPTLDAMYFIMNKLGNPQNHLKFIHIAGTNGKGSICEMLNRILILSNYKVGKFTTPHLICSNEEIAINDVNISDFEFESYIELFTNISNEYFEKTGRKVTRFEIITSLAILYFYKNNCDIVIFEVGLGGKYDSTNIVNSLISVFGQISFDHTAILGNTLEEIAIQKAGIIKENNYTVIFNQPADKIISKFCKEKNSKLSIVKKDDISNYKFDSKYQYFDFENYKGIKLNLKGKKQIENACTAIKCIEILNKNGYIVSDNNIFLGLQNLYHPARFETISENPLIIFDGAHNENAILNFCDTVNSLYNDYQKNFIVQFITTKDYKKNIDILLNSFNNSTFVFTDGSDKNKFFNRNILFEYAISQNTSNTILCDDFEHAILNLNNEINFIVGSFYVYKNVYELLMQKRGG